MKDYYTDLIEKISWKIDQLEFSIANNRDMVHSIGQRINTVREKYYNDVQQTATGCISQIETNNSCRKEVGITIKDVRGELKDVLWVSQWLMEIIHIKSTTNYAYLKEKMVIQEQELKTYQEDETAYESWANTRLLLTKYQDQIGILEYKVVNHGTVYYRLSHTVDPILIKLKIKNNETRYLKFPGIFKYSQQVPFPNQFRNIILEGNTETEHELSFQRTDNGLVINLQNIEFTTTDDFEFTRKTYNM